MNHRRQKHRELILSEIEKLESEGKESVRTKVLTDRINSRTDWSISYSTITRYVTCDNFDDIDFSKQGYDQTPNQWVWSWNTENYYSETGGNSEGSE